MTEGVRDDHPKRCRFGDVQLSGVERFGKTFDQIANQGDVPNGSGNAFAALEKLIGELAAESAANAGDKPVRCDI
jgi:hypothetical protein